MDKPLTIFSDRPTKKDSLNFGDYVDILAGIVRVCETPMTVGILGEWGSGKTSLMLMIEDRLGQEGIPTIWFNAWKYDKEDSLWRALILRILERLKADEEDTREIYQKLYSTVSSEELGKVQINWLEAGKAITKQGIKAAATIALPVAGIGAVLEKLRETLTGEASLDELSKAISRQTIKTRQDRITSIEEFERLYSRLLRHSVGQEHRLVVFIDDLDRCLPERALEVFEALKTFLDAEGCVYLVACDQRLIHQGLKDKYGEAAGIDIEDYLEKIIQLSFEIPPIRTEDAQEFISRLGRSTELQSLVEIITAGMEYNPRKLKRFLNNLEVQRRLVSARDLGMEEDVLVKLSCITYGWKHIWTQVLDNPTLLTELQKYAIDERLTEKVGEKPWINEILERERRLIGFLRHPPDVSDEDVDEYIYLARTTSLSVPEMLPFEAIVNPYVVGPPLRNLELVYGRENLIATILEHLSNPDVRLIVLQGQRRMGKTTLLYQLRRLLNESSLVVLIDMEAVAIVRGEGDLFQAWARRVIRAMTAQGYEPPAPDDKESVSDPAGFDRFIEDAVATLSDRRLVLLVDEFDVIERMIVEERISYGFLAFLRSLVQHQPSVAMVITVSRCVEELSTMLRSTFFTLGLTLKVGYLSRADTAALITEPVRGDIEYGDDAIGAITDLTGGHPFFVQLVCRELLDSLNKDQRSWVTRVDVDNALSDILEIGGLLFNFVWAQGNAEERVLLSLIAESVVEKNIAVTHNGISTELQRRSIPLDQSVVLGALNGLYGREVLVRKTVDGEDEFDFAVPLVAHWIRRYQPLEVVLEALRVT